MGVFAGAGFEHIAPDILQPADIFLERSGEEIRESAYLFSDPAGAELCLRTIAEGRGVRTIDAPVLHLSTGRIDATFD